MPTSLRGTAPAPLVPASLYRPTSGHTQNSVRIAAPPPEVHRRRPSSDRWWAGAIRKRHCTAAESLQWCSVVPVLIEHTRDTTTMPPTDDSVKTEVAESD